MNRKNRMAQLASQASVQFNTFQYFKLQSEQNRQVNAIVMRMAPAGVYVLIQKYGIEGLLIEDLKPSEEDLKKKKQICQKITTDPANE